MAYLQPADYPNYGLPDGTSADWITAATALINSYCRRPDLNVIAVHGAPAPHQRIAQTVRLTYLPLAPLGDAQPHPSSACRDGMRSRGAAKLPTTPLARRCLGLFAAGPVDRDRSRARWICDPNTGELTLPWNLLGLPYNEVIGDLHGRTGHDRRRRQDRVRADCAQCAVDAGAERQQDQDRHDADAVLLEFAAGRDREGLAASLRCEQVGVSHERYSTAQSGRRAADACRCPAAQRRRNQRRNCGLRERPPIRISLNWAWLRPRLVRSSSVPS